MDTLIHQGGFDSVALQWASSIMLLLMFALITRHASGTLAGESWRQARLWMLVAISIILFWVYVAPVFFIEHLGSDGAGTWIALGAYLFSKCMFWGKVASGTEALGRSQRTPQRLHWRETLLALGCLGLMWAFPSLEAATLFQAMFAIPALWLALRYPVPVRRKGEAGIVLLRIGLAVLMGTWGVYCAAFLGPVLDWPALTETPFAVLWLPNAYLDTLLDSVLTMGMIVCVIEHAQRKSQLANEERLARIGRQQTAILELAKAPQVASGDLESLTAILTEAAAQTLDVDRVSIWTFDAECEQLICRDLFSRPEQSHTPGAVLPASDYPHYFAALEEGRAINASDATTDPRTRELLHPYLAQLGIGSMLDVSIRSGSKVIGVVCHEHLGGPRTWNHDEIAFAGYVADLVAQANSNQRAIEAERQQHQLERQLRHSQKLDAVGHLASGIAHDFNNQIAAIMGYAALAEEETHPQALKYLPEILAAAERAAQLTRKLLSFSRRQVLATQVVELNQIVCNVSSLMGHVVQANIEVLTQTSEQLGRVRADPAELEQVFLNLANNAADAMPGGGTLSLETRLAARNESEMSGWMSEGDWAVVSVGDTGTGMDADHLELIFEPFFTTKPDGLGTGLGLATSYGIVEQHAGHITVESELGRGSVFKVWLPLVELPLSPQVAPLGQPAQGGTETILVIEDEPQLRVLMESLLTKAGYSVMSAESGETGLELFHGKAQDIDLLLLDTDLPGKSGPEVLREIRSSAGGVPAVLTSGRGMEVDALELGVALPKPFSNQALLNAVRLALDAQLGSKPLTNGRPARP